MADVSLNGLKVKTDSLPNDWYVSLINPKSEEPAEIMTVAKLVELFTGKQPEATDTSNGLMSVDAYKSLLRYKGVWTKDNVDSLTTNGTWINTGGNNISETMVWGILCVFNAGSYIAQMSVRGSEVRVRFSANNGNTWSDPIILNNSVAYTATANALTDTIQTSPVLESRQVRSTCLQNHLYQILLPTCQDRMDRMVQFQLKRNHQENSISGQSTRSEKLSWNYRKKTRDLNKSSISLTIARYNKCNLPRAGPPRLIN